MYDVNSNPECGIEVYGFAGKSDFFVYLTGFRFLLLTKGSGSVRCLPRWGRWHEVPEGLVWHNISPPAISVMLNFVPN